jgi:hypothetical protein
MNKDQQRIKIAEACGWTAEQDSNGYWRAVHKSTGNAVELWLSEQNVWSVGIPDYLNDLNAMHEAEKMLTEDQLSDYGAFLKGKDNETVSLYTPEHREIAKVAMASAAQRAEAFLRTINKWTTNPNEL